MPIQQVQALIISIFIPRRFPYAIATRVKLHAIRDMVIGILFGYIGQVSWSYTTPWLRLASKALPYQGSLAIREAPAMLLEDSCPQVILKFNFPSSLDYTACQGLPILQKFTIRSSSSDQVAIINITFIWYDINFCCHFENTFWSFILVCFTKKFGST